MTRPLSWTLIFFAATLGAAHAVPARPLYEPPEHPKPSVPIELRGTTWRGKDYSDNRVMVFMPDGTVHYGTGKIQHKNGTWKLVGDDLYFEMNNQYREFKGKVIGDTIVGESWNIAKMRWETKLHRDGN